MTVALLQVVLIIRLQPVRLIPLAVRLFVAPQVFARVVPPPTVRLTEEVLNLLIILLLPILLQTMIAQTVIGVLSDPRSSAVAVFALQRLVVPVVIPRAAVEELPVAISVSMLLVAVSELGAMLATREAPLAMEMFLPEFVAAGIVMHPYMNGVTVPPRPAIIVLTRVVIMPEQKWLPVVQPLVELSQRPVAPFPLLAHLQLSMEISPVQVLALERLLVPEVLNAHVSPLANTDPVRVTIVLSLAQVFVLRVEVDPGTRVCRVTLSLHPVLNILDRRVPVPVPNVLVVVRVPAHSVQEFVAQLVLPQLRVPVVPTLPLRNRPLAPIVVSPRKSVH